MGLKSTQLTGQGPQMIAQGLMTSSSTQYHKLGERVVDNTGRAFRYVLCGGTSLVPGNVIQSPAVVANHVNLTPTAAVAVGDSSVTLTLGATLATANQYAGGILTVEKGTTGAGQSQLIDSTPAAASAATLLVSLADVFVTATSGTVTMSLIANRFNGVIQSPVTTLTGTIVGVAIFPIVNAQYGWICSRGLTGVLSDGIQTVGATAAAVPAAAAGAAKVMAATLFSIGHWSKTTIDTQITPCFLTID